MRIKKLEYRTSGHGSEVVGTIWEELKKKGNRDFFIELTSKCGTEFHECNSLEEAQSYVLSNLENIENEKRRIPSNSFFQSR